MSEELKAALEKLATSWRQTDDWNKPHKGLALNGSIEGVLREYAREIGREQ